MDIVFTNAAQERFNLNKLRDISQTIFNCKTKIKGIDDKYIKIGCVFRCIATIYFDESKKFVSIHLNNNAYVIEAIRLCKKLENVHKLKTRIVFKKADLNIADICNMCEEKLKCVVSTESEIDCPLFDVKKGNFVFDSKR